MTNIPLTPINLYQAIVACSSNNRYQFGGKLCLKLSLKKYSMIAFPWWWTLVRNRLRIPLPDSQGWLSQMEVLTSPPRRVTALMHWCSGLEATSWWEDTLNLWRYSGWIRYRCWSTSSIQWKLSRRILLINLKQSGPILPSIIYSGMTGSQG